MTFTLRPMHPGDLHPVLAIAAASPEAPQWPGSAYEPYFAHDPANPALLRTALVAECPDEPRLDTQLLLEGRDSRLPGGPVLAFACATLLLDGTQTLCQLDSIAVRPTRRRQGIGAALLHEILRWAREENARQFSLEVRASNNAAILLYRRFGLLPEGRRPHYYADPVEDALILGKPVTRGTP